MPRLWPALILLLAAGCDSAAPPPAAPSLVGEWALAGTSARLRVTARVAGDYVDYRAPVRGAITADGTALRVTSVSADHVGLSGALAGRPLHLTLGAHAATLQLGVGAGAEAVTLTPSGPPVRRDGAALAVAPLTFETRGGPVAVGGTAVFPTIALAAGVEAEVPPLLPSGADCDETHAFSDGGAYAYATTCEGHRSDWAGRWALEGSALETTIAVEDRFGRGGPSELVRSFEAAVGARTLGLTAWSPPCEGACASWHDAEVGLPAGTLQSWREGAVGHFSRAPGR